MVSAIRTSHYFSYSPPLFLYDIRIFSSSPLLIIATFLTLDVTAVPSPPPPCRPLLLSLEPLGSKDITASPHYFDCQLDWIFLSFEHPTSPCGMHASFQCTIQQTQPALTATRISLAPKLHLLLRSLLPLDSQPIYHSTQQSLFSSCSDQLLLLFEYPLRNCAFVVLRPISSAQVTNLVHVTPLPTWPLHAGGITGETTPLKGIARLTETRTWPMTAVTTSTHTTVQLPSIPADTSLVSFSKSPP